jgi:hypothetical protein
MPPQGFGFAQILEIPKDLQQPERRSPIYGSADPCVVEIVMNQEISAQRVEALVNELSQSGMFEVPVSYKLGSTDPDAFGFLQGCQDLLESGTDVKQPTSKEKKEKENFLDKQDQQNVKDEKKRQDKRDRQNKRSVQNMVMPRSVSFSPTQPSPASSPQKIKGKATQPLSSSDKGSAKGGSNKKGRSLKKSPTKTTAAIQRTLLAKDPSIRSTLVKAVAQLPQEDQLRLLGELSKTEGELLRSSSSLEAVKKAGQASAAAPSSSSSSSPRASTNAAALPASDDDMSSAGQSMGAASHSLQSIGSMSTVTLSSMASQMTDYSKFVPTNIYNKSQGLVKKGLASVALKKVGRAMAAMGVKAKARGVDLEMCGYAELRARLHTDLGLELSATEVDQLMRKFDHDHQGQVEINTLLGSAALLHDQRKRRQHVAKTVEEQRKLGRVVDERIRAEDRAANALGEAAYDAIVRGDVSVEYPKNIRAGALMSRKDFRKLLKTLGLDLNKEARRELEERYHEPSNPK